MLSGKAAIVGIGATDFSKNSGRSELRLAAEAVLDALDDAGLSPADVDGLTTFTMDTNKEIAVARATGMGDLKFFSQGALRRRRRLRDRRTTPRWPSRPGVADVVVAYRAFNERSGMRFGQVQTRWWEALRWTRIRRRPTTPSRIRTGFRRPRRRWR